MNVKGYVCQQKSVRTQAIECDRGPLILDRKIGADRLKFTYFMKLGSQPVILSGSNGVAYLAALSVWCCDWWYQSNSRYSYLP